MYMIYGETVLLRHPMLTKGTYKLTNVHTERHTYAHLVAPVWGLYLLIKDLFKKHREELRGAMFISVGIIVSAPVIMSRPVNRFIFLRGASEPPYSTQTRFRLKAY